MILKLVNAISLHNGGGLTYLFFLKEYLDKKGNILILDHRIKNKISFTNSRVLFIKRGLFRNFRIFFIRFIFYFISIFKYKKNKNKIIEIYLNGIPPFLRFPNSKIYIFCQNRLVFQKYQKIKSLNLSLIQTNLIIVISKILFNLFIRNSDEIIVQTPSMKNLITKFLENKITFQNDIWGEYDSKALKRIINYNKKVNNKELENYLYNLKKNNIVFFYPACYFQHKNHKNLIKAFNLLTHKNIKSHKLIFTFNQNELKNKSITDNKNIIFLGHLNYFDILNTYKFVDYLVFPSLSESYGLPLLEAKINKVKIIASNLRYVLDVCDPFIIFNPLSPEDIFEKIAPLL